MTKTVLIDVGTLSLVLSLPEFGMPEILSFDEHTALLDDNDILIERSSRINGMDVAVPSAVLLPVGGMGFFGWPAIAGHRDGTDFTLQFTNWTSDQIASRCVLSASDPVAKIEIEIHIDGHASGVVSMSTTIKNVGQTDYTLDRCMAGSFLLPAGKGELTSYTGMWGREFQTRKSDLPTALWMQENRRGRTSHDRYPTLFADVGDSTFGFHLGWSGNHTLAIDTLDDGRRLVHLGELFEPGEMRLAPGARYESPKAYASSGTEAFHAFVRENLIDWPNGEMKPRPVLLNTWEGNYFDHKMTSLKAQAEAAAAIGIERFVLDDGWFGKRDDDTTSLGDWFVDPRKYPNGLGELVEHVTSLGMEFGIWFEPEMVNPESDLFQKHPDWVLQVKGRPLLLSRNQLVLDLTRSDVTDYLFERISDVLSANRISYIKWDMNRDLTHAGGPDGRARASAQTRAVYALMDRVRAAFPHVEIESCASGGGRIDFGVLQRTHRVWTSDCTDALERLDIQRGASTLLPPELLGSHISASPNHQTHRRLSFTFRAIVALAYHLGVELNPLTLEKDEAQELKSWIVLHKRLRPLLHAPETQFRQEPLDGRYVWGAADESRVALFMAQGPQMVAEQPAPVRIHLDSDPEQRWRVVAMHPAKPDFIRISDAQTALLSGEISFSTATLAARGLNLPMLRPESAILLEIEPIIGSETNG
jgi:alpha-galactosidase